MYDNEQATEAALIDAGHTRLSGDKLRELIACKTVQGLYRRGFRYVTFIGPDGSLEGRNHVGCHHFGKWWIDTDSGLFSVKWDNGWDNTTTAAYEVDGEVRFFDRDTGLWRTTFSGFESGKTSLQAPA